MPPERLVAVSYPAGDDLIQTSTSVLDGDARLVFLAGRPDGERRQVLRQAEALLAWELSRELPAGALTQAPRLRFVQLLSAGADMIDFSSVPERLILAGNVGAYSEPIAEHVLAMTLALARRLPQHHAAMARGEWLQETPLLTLKGKVCGVLGYGGIGRATARLMRALGMRIHAVNSSGTAGEPVEFAGTLADLDRVLAAADVLVVALPLTVTTRGLLGAREFALMKPDAILVNVARAAIVEEQALYTHLRDHPDFGAGIDVWWDEPRPGGRFRVGCPFFSLPNMIGSPHNSGTVPGIMASAARHAAENVLRYLRGEPVAGVMRREDYLLP